MQSTPKLTSQNNAHVPPPLPPKKTMHIQKGRPPANLRKKNCSIWVHVAGQCNMHCSKLAGTSEILAICYKTHMQKQAICYKIRTCTNSAQQIHEMISWIISKYNTATWDFQRLTHLHPGSYLCHVQTLNICQCHVQSLPEFLIIRDPTIIRLCLHISS
jgi:hypothetical protein